MFEFFCCESPFLNVSQWLTSFSAVEWKYLIILRPLLLKRASAAQWFTHSLVDMIQFLYPFLKQRLLFPGMSSRCVNLGRVQAQPHPVEGQLFTVSGSFRCWAPASLKIIVPFSLAGEERNTFKLSSSSLPPIPSPTQCISLYSPELQV